MLRQAVFLGAGEEMNSPEFHPLVLRPSLDQIEYGLLIHSELAAVCEPRENAQHQIPFGPHSVQQLQLIRGLRGVQRPVAAVIQNFFQIFFSFQHPGNQELFRWNFQASAHPKFPVGAHLNSLGFRKGCRSEKRIGFHAVGQTDFIPQVFSKILKPL